MFFLEQDSLTFYLKIISVKYTQPHCHVISWGTKFSFPQTPCFEVMKIFFFKQMSSNNIVYLWVLKEVLSLAKNIKCPYGYLQIISGHRSPSSLPVWETLQCTVGMVWLCVLTQISPCSSHNSHMLWEWPRGRWLNHGGGSFPCCPRDKWMGLMRSDGFKNRNLSEQALSLPAAIHVRCDLLLLTFCHDCEVSLAMWNWKSNKPFSFVNCPVLGMFLSAVWKRTKHSLIYFDVKRVVKCYWNSLNR